MKRWWTIALILLPITILMALRKNSEASSAYSRTKEITELRNIAHQLLLKYNDAHSRVLPVKKTSASEYLIQFEKPFTFYPNPLIQIFRANFKSQDEYSVEVRDKANSDVVYSFVMSKDSSATIIPCLGRVLPRSSYEILVHIPQYARSYALYWLIGAGILLAITAWAISSKPKPRPEHEEAPPVEEPLSHIPIGRYRFYTDTQRLELDGNTVDLTGKEKQLLTIFSQSPNTIIDRSRLQKEVWEDEGVIVTRSLDMFISKLRKKLSGDPSVKIVNVHGKGYKLEA